MASPKSSHRDSSPIRQLSVPPRSGTLSCSPPPACPPRSRQSQRVLPRACSPYATPPSLPIGPRPETLFEKLHHFMAEDGPSPSQKAWTSGDTRPSATVSLP